MEWIVSSTSYIQIDDDEVEFINKRSIKSGLVYTFLYNNRSNELYKFTKMDSEPTLINKKNLVKQILYVLFFNILFINSNKTAISVSFNNLRARIDMRREMSKLTVLR